MTLPRPLGRLVEIAVFAPIGLCSLIREQLPAVGKRIAQERQAVINRTQLAQLAVRVAADRAARASQPTAVVEPAASRSQAPDGTAGMTQATPSPVAVDDAAAAGAVVAAVEADRSTIAAEADALPISDYESLAAIHVVHRLPTLRPDELEQVRVFERAHRARRTILAKIEQLQESAS